MALTLAPTRIFASTELSNEDYHSTPGLSASQLKFLSPDLTPLDFWRQSWMNPEREFEGANSKALKFGQAAHMLLLEGEKVFNDHWQIKQGVKETGVAGMLAEGEYNTLLRIRDVLLGNPLYAKMIEGCQSEVSILGEVEVIVDMQAPKDMGKEVVPVRTRLDMFKPSFALDLKFMSEVTKTSVAYAITDYGYDRQADWNLRILKMGFPEVKHHNFITLFVEKDSKYPKVLPVTYPDDLLTHVKSRNENALERFAQMKRKYGTEKPWPGYENRIYNVWENGTGDGYGIELPVRWNYLS